MGRGFHCKRDREGKPCTGYIGRTPTVNPVEQHKYKIFVSYSRHDEGLVKPLAGLIALADSGVFFDVQELKPGDLWENEICSAIRNAPVFVLCWCCQSKRSKFVSKEITLALEDTKKRIVPVRLCEQRLPKDLERRQWIDLRGKVQHECGRRHRARVAGAGPPRLPLSKDEQLSQWLGVALEEDMLAYAAAKYFLDLSA
jgi:TIR domain-containing protein